MADNKRSFVLYCDYITTFEELDDAEAGRLIKHIFRYVNDKNPETDDRLLKLIFEPIKQHLKRDLKKWDKYIEKQKINGKKGGRPKTEDETQKTQAFYDENRKPKKADSVSVSVSVNESVKQQAEAQDLSDKVDKFLSNQRRNEAFCMQNHITMGDLSNIQKQFIREVDVDKINDLWSYFRTVYMQGKYDGFIKKMVM